MSVYGSFSVREETADIAAIAMEAVMYLRCESRRYDAIAVTGVSGLMIGSPVAIMLGKPLIIIRKDTENAHSSRHPGLDMDGTRARYLFLDDFIALGETKCRVISAISQKYPHATMVGQYLYEGQTSLVWFDENV
jgi:adenine/guanine phosphoribosyltransferase-like PRPP-binding protein